MLQTSNLHFAYDATAVFDFPSIRVEEGESALILGNSGSGKTTWLHLLGLILSPHEGTIEIGGTTTHSLSTKEIDVFRGQQIGIVFQRPHFIRALSTLDNLIYAQRFAKQELDASFCKELLDRLGLGDSLNKQTTALSIGQQQRLGIARALVNKPSLILADEPTSALDDENCKTVISLLKEQAKELNTSLLIVTHDQRLKAAVDHQIELNHV